MTFVALVPTEISITDFSKADSGVFDWFEEIKEEAYPNILDALRKLR